MAYWIKHKFQSAKADGTDVTLVKPTNWNDEHELWMDEGTIIGRPPGGGSGPGESIPISSLMPVGMVTPYAGSVAPASWLLCQGQSLLRADYPGLFAAIGSTYGSVDATHFNVPDLRGRVVAGVDGGADRIGSIVGGVLGNAGGQEMAQYYADVNVYGGNRAYGATGGEALTAHVWGSTSHENGSMGVVGGGPAIGSHSHSVDIWGNTSGTQSAWVDIGLPSSGGGYTRNDTNMQPTIVLNYIIKT